MGSINKWITVQTSLDRKALDPIRKITKEKKGGGGVVLGKWLKW
jgi:hypothetical protein